MVAVIPATGKRNDQSKVAVVAGDGARAQRAGAEGGNQAPPPENTIT